MRTIRGLIIMATISIVGIIITQVYWVRKSIELNENQFNHSVQIALRNTAQKVAEYNNSTMVNSDPVVSISSDYFVVNINDAIDANILEHYLISSFAERGLKIDFEYGIYDCSSDKMVYGRYISVDKQRHPEMFSYDLPRLSDYSYYFVVHFPNKVSYLAMQLSFWVFLSLILVIVITFFGYALFVIFRQRRLSEIQKDFINNMTHEFKTPISTIAISAEVLMNPAIVNQPERLRNYASIIRNENNRLKNQVEKVLQMAKIDKEKINLNYEVLDLHELILESVAGFGIKAQQREGTIHTQLNATQHQIKADRVHLTNVVYNLLDNAIKYSPESPYIEIFTHNKGNAIILSIKDNGIGIAEEYQRRVFDKFFRIPTGNIHNVKGFGLGLNYVKSIIKAHRWKISLHSIVGRGTTFFITIKM